MSVGKPILHFYYHDDDVNIKYLEKYDLAIMIKMDEKLFEENAEKLKHFLQKTYNKKADSAKLDHAFYKNDPDYTAKYFMKLAGSYNNHIPVEISHGIEALTYN